MGRREILPGLAERRQVKVARKPRARLQQPGGGRQNSRARSDIQESIARAQVPFKSLQCQLGGGLIAGPRSLARVNRQADPSRWSLIGTPARDQVEARSHGERLECVHPTGLLVLMQMPGGREPRQCGWHRKAFAEKSLQLALAAG